MIVRCSCENSSYENARLLLHNLHLTNPNKLFFLTQLTPQRLYRRHNVGPKHSTYHMVEYRAIFPSQSAAMHERLKHLHHISCLSQSSLVTHWQSESKFPSKKKTTEVVLWLPGWWSQWEGEQSVGLMLMEQFRALVGTWQRNVSSLSLRLNVCCERPRGSTVSTHRTEAFWSFIGV